MSKYWMHIISWCLLVVSLQSCGIAKFLEDGEVMYSGNEFTFDEPELIAYEGRLKSNLEKKLYPSPNKRFLGLFYTRQWLYLKVEPKENREKGFKHWLKNKIGKKPILIENVDQPLMEQLVSKTMQDNGYFNTTTTSEIINKKNSGKIHFEVDNQSQIYIDSLVFPKGYGELDSIIANYKFYQTKEHKDYNLDKLNADRTNLATHVRSLGYFDFDEQDIYFIIDTSKMKYSVVDVHVKLKQRNKEKTFKKYYISDVKVYPTTDFQNLYDDTSGFKNHFTYKGIYFEQDYEFVGRKALYRNIIIEPGQLFSVQNYDYTVERLTNLDVFKYVNINYTKNENDSLTVEIKLTPGKYQSIRADVEASTSNRSFLGTSLAVSYDNRNLFGGAENLNVKASGGTEFQVVNQNIALNILDVNFEISLAVPRLLTFLNTKKIRSNIPPKTKFSLQENYQQWLEYYTYNSINLSYGYDWRTRKDHHHQFNPFFFNILSLLNTTETFDDILSENPLLRTSFESNVIIGRNYTYSVSTQKTKGQRNHLFFSGNTEMAGEVGYLIAKITRPNAATPYEFFGTPFSQYIKFDTDTRFYQKIGVDQLFAVRFNAGIGIAYGNSEVLPYVKQFYVGGPNTLRAFPFRSVGPGRYSTEDTDNANPLEQSGDIRLLINAEYRYPIYNFIKGAVFVDMGNVWLRKEDANRPEGQFKWNEFYRQFAIGTGTGIRLDFDFFAIRADLGVPLYKPYAPPGERWINQFQEQGFKEWRRENWVWNIAIGYPF